MEKVYLAGELFETDGSNLKHQPEDKGLEGVNCSGNACADIDMQWDEDTRSYHFYNDGNRKLKLRVNSATYFGCTAVWKTRNMRPGDEWDSRFFGVCKYESNYR